MQYGNNLTSGSNLIWQRYTFLHGNHTVMLDIVLLTALWLCAKQGVTTYPIRWKLMIKMLTCISTRVKLTWSYDTLKVMQHKIYDFHEWRSHEWKSLANLITSDQKSLFTVTNVLSYFLHATLCLEHKILVLALWRHISRLFLQAQIGAKAIFTSE